MIAGLCLPTYKPDYLPLSYTRRIHSKRSRGVSPQGRPTESHCLPVKHLGQPLAPLGLLVVTLWLLWHPSGAPWWTFGERCGFLWHPGGLLWRPGCSFGTTYWGLMLDYQRPMIDDGSQIIDTSMFGVGTNNRLYATRYSYQVPSTRFQVPNTPSTWYHLVPCTKYFVPCTKYFVPCAK